MKKTIQFSEEQVRQFAEWSADRNPLHVDQEFARGTHFGRPLVHGMLSVLATLRQADAALWSGRPGEIDIEFRGGVFTGTDYEINESADGNLLTLSTLNGAAVVSIRQSATPPPSAAASAAWTAGLSAANIGGPSMPAIPAERCLDELRRGAEVTGVYPAAVDDMAQTSTSLDRILALCSYIVGMQLPGRQSLFTRAIVSFRQSAVGVPEPLLYRAKSARFDANFRLLDIDVDVAAPDGTLRATARLRSYVPFCPITTEAASLAAWVADGRRSLEGKVALVIGGTKGLGVDLSTALALAGCTVYPTGRSRA
jgi:hypothetical protein